MDPYYRDVYGECMADDIIPLCKEIAAIAKELGVNMDITQTKLFTSIVQYIELRCEAPAHEIRGPHRKVTAPIGWTAKHEAIWRQWIFHAFTFDDWHERITGRIFGSEERLWEPAGWRDEIYGFLPYWFMRSLSRFEEIDPSPLPDEEEVAALEEKEKRQRQVDPYVDDYYGELR